MDVIVSDFDNTLFKKNHGLIRENVEYLEQQGYPIYIVTYRALSQKMFMQETLAPSGLNVVGYAMAESRIKDPRSKVTLIEYIMTRHNVVEALDDDPAVVLAYRQRGINARQV